MQQIDVRFNAKELGLLRNIVGRVITKYKCDPFVFSKAIYGVVGICTANSAYAFTNSLQVMDYYGAKEDVAVFRIDKCIESNIQSLMDGGKMIDLPVNKMVKEVHVINEHQELFENGKQIDDVRLTRGVIFKFEDGTEVSLEKDVWFSEMIIVEDGEHLLEKFAPAQEFAEDWEENFHAECSREIVRII